MVSALLIRFPLRTTCRSGPQGGERGPIREAVSARPAGERGGSGCAPRRVRKRAKDVTGRADLQRQAVALVYGVADCARRIDAMQANALVLVAYIERCPFVRLLDHIAKNGNDNVGGAKMPLIQRSEVE